MHTVSSKLAKQWNALHKELSVVPDRKPKLAGLFLGWKPRKNVKILLVGKATSGEFKNAARHERVFSAEMNSAFWDFARKLNKIVGGDNKLTNLGWTNISKIGVVARNPSLSLQLAQHSLAVETLRQEIKDCQPAIVVFVCDGHADEAVYEAVMANKGGFNDFETRGRDYGEFYLRKAVSIGGIDYPSMLWLRHPERKLQE